MAVTYQTLMVATQSAVWTCLKNDATLTGLTRNILSGVPTTITRETGFPYVRVKAPMPTEKFETLVTYLNPLPVEIEIYTTKEANIWPIADAIRAALQANAVQFRLTNNLLLKHENISSSQTHTIMDELENKPLYYFTMKVMFRWWGRP